MFALIMKILPLFVSQGEIDAVMTVVKIVIVVVEVLFPPQASFEARWGVMNFTQQESCVENPQLRQCSEQRVMFDSFPISQ